MKKTTSTSIVSAVVIGLLVGAPLTAHADTVTSDPTTSASTEAAPVADTTTATPTDTEPAPEASPSADTTPSEDPAPTDSESPAPAPSSEPAPEETTPAAPTEQPMEATTNVQAKGNENGIDVTWESNFADGGINYVILVYSDGYYQGYGYTSGHSVHLDITGLKSYDISVTESRNYESGPFGGGAHIIMDYPAIAVTDVSGNVTSARKDNQAHVTWTAAQYADSYTVTLKPSNGAAAITQTVTGTSADFVLPQTANLTYTATVSTTSTRGTTSADPVQLSGNTVGYVSDPVSNVQISQVTPNVGTSLKITWDRPEFTGGNPTAQTIVLVYDYNSNSYVVNNNNVQPVDTTSYVFPGVEGHRYNAYVYLYSANTPGGNASQGTASPAFTNTVVRAPDAPTIANVKTFQNPDDSYSSNIAWNPSTTHNANVDDYVVTVTGDNGFTKQLSVSGTQTSVNINLPYDHTAKYTATIKATSSAGDSPVSTSDAFSLVNGRPTPVQDLSAEGNNLTSININWDAPRDNGGSDIKTYTVVLTPRDDSNDVITREVYGPGIVTGVKTGVKYDITVSAVNSDNLTSKSSNTTGSSTIAAPDVPANIAGSFGFGSDLDGNKTATITWDAAETHGTPVTGYDVLLYTEDGTLIETQTVNSDTHEVSFTVPTNHTMSFYATVSANSAAGNSGAIPTPRFSQPVEAPSSVQNLQVEYANINSANITFDAPKDDGGSPVDNYTVEVRQADGHLVAFDTTSDTRYFVKDLRPGQDYTVTVTAHTVFGFTSDSSTVGFTTKSTVPDQPTMTEIHRADNNLVITWAKPDFDGGSPVTGYTVTLIDSDGAVKTVDVDADSEITPSYFVEGGARTGKSYSVTVSAFNENGQSVTNDTASYATSATAPSIPLNVTATQDADNHVTLNWDAPESDGGTDITGYAVILYTDKTGEFGQVDADTFSYTFNTRLAPGETYLFRVVALNSTGASVPSDEVIIKTKPESAPTAPTESEITAATPAGTVTVNTSVQTATFHGDKANAGDWVYGYVYSKAVGLGWEQLNADGEATWSYKDADLADGSHTFVVVNLDNEIAAKQAFKISPVDTGIGGGTGTTPIPVPGDSNGSGTTGTGNTVTAGTVTTTPVVTAADSDESLAYTGSDNVGATLTIGGLLALLGAFLVTRRRRTTKTN